MYYIETTNGNNSIVYRWAPGTCPGPSLAATYTYSNVFVVGLDFNPVTGYGYQIEFSTGSAPYSIYLRQIFSFSPFISGSPQIINLPAGVSIGIQSGDVVFTPSGKLYFTFDNKLFNLDFSTYGIGSLNAVLIDSLNVGAGNKVVGLAYAQGQFVASISDPLKK
jgi:hypothetical protein